MHTQSHLQPFAYPQNPGLGLRERWAALSTPKKAAVVTGGVVTVVGVAMLVRYVTRPNPIPTVTPQCNDFAFADRTEVAAAILPIIHAAAEEGAVDPFAVTTRFLRAHAPACRSYPEEARNPGEAKLYVQAFSEVMRVMQEQKLVSPDQRTYFLEMVAVWGKSQGLAQQDLPAVPPEVAPQGA